MSNDFIKLSCPRCDKRLKLSAQKLRRKIVCPACGDTFSWQAFRENSPIPDEASQAGYLDPAEVALMQVEPDAQDLDTAARSGSNPGEEAVSDATLTTLSADGESGPAKAEQWLEQRQLGAERSRAKWRSFGVGLILLALAAVLAQWIGYRFRFLDALAFGMDGGFGVFYFILLGIAGTFLVAWTRAGSRPRLYGIPVLVSLLLIGVGMGSFLSARSVDARREAEMTAQQQRPLPAVPNRRSAVLIQRNQPGGPTVRRLPARETEPGADTGSRPARSPANGPTEASRPLPLQPVFPRADRSEETFRPSDQVTDFTVDQLIEKTDENPFRSMNVAESRSANGQGDLGDESEREVPRPDVVRDILTYPDKRAALLQRRKSLLPIRVIGGKVQDAAQFESFQLSETAGKQTKFGWIYLGSQPCRGLDTLKDSTLNTAPLQLVLPIHGQPEFSDSLYHRQGYYLAGIKVNMANERVVGIQALLAPGKESRMDMQNLEASAWVGQETGDQQFRLNATSGKAVYGIVVYEEKLRITGIGLVQKK